MRRDEPMHEITPGHGPRAAARIRREAPRNRLLVLLGVAVLLSAVPVWAADRVCAPEHMLKVVTRMDVPGVAPDHFSRVPKTLYRSGTAYGRVEEAYNQVTHLHLLIVVSEPDLWIVNLATRTGRHVRDPGPTYYFRARLFGDAQIASQLIRALELGCEIAWLREAGAREEPVTHATLGQTRRLSYSDATDAVILYERANTPLRVELLQNGHPTFAMEYLEFSPHLRFDQKLFGRPPGIRFDGNQGGGK